jgi:hypothetical protein
MEPETGHGETAGRRTALLGRLALGTMGALYPSARDLGSACAR